MSDSGVFSYPRYHARLQPVPLDKQAQYTVALSGLPSEHMNLLFYVSGGNQAAREALQSVSAQLSVSLERAGAEPICSARGSLGSGWVLMSSISSAAFWQRACTDLPIRAEASYLLHLEVSPAGPNAAHLVLVPTLEGGGNELP
jgi:hypothetical protein